jgi:riboflavin kinase/FMN adenylyltransferase
LVVLTFQPHPLEIIRPDKAPAALTPPELKEHLIAELGADCLCVLKSTAELLTLSPTDFVERFLVNGIRPSVVVEGDDFNFGAGRDGNIHTLQKLGQEKDFEVRIIDSQKAKISDGPRFIGVEVSSTMIRSMLAQGNVADAAIELGRPYRLIGKIVPGRGKGRQLGFPTLNMEKPNQLIPAEGVYAGFVGIADSLKKVCATEAKKEAAFSIGRAVTYPDKSGLLIEAHLLSENPGDLSGKWLAMDFVQFIRSQQKFESEAELKKQIAKDCETTKKILYNFAKGSYGNQQFFSKSG